jgi:hypothetical protein
MNFLEDNAFYLSAVCSGELLYESTVIVLRSMVFVAVAFERRLTVFCQVMPCIMVDVHEHFRGIC